MKKTLKIKLMLILTLGMAFIFPLLSIEYFNSKKLFKEINPESKKKNQLKSAIFDAYDWSKVIVKPVGNEPMSIFIGDANNDGYNDIVVANMDDDAGDDDVSIYLWNETTGDWDEELRKRVGNYPASVFIADANNDGYNDIVTANYGGNTISVCTWNNLTNNWNSQIKRSTHYYPFSVSVGDANNDGYNDIITSNFGGDDVSLRLWNETSQDWDIYIEKPVGGTPVSVSIKDANNDGLNDIVTANSNSDDVSIYLWNETIGDWNSQIKLPLASNSAPWGVYIGDANNDGKNDIVTAEHNRNDIGILIWNQTIGYWNPRIKKNSGGDPRSVFIGDANNDGFNDIATANAASGDISICLWNETIGDWNSHIRRSAGDHAWSVFIGDANNDGYNDIATANQISDDITVRLWTLPYINIITPENKTYGGSMSGYYPATYGFENDIIGETQPDRFNNQYSTSCSGEVISEIDGHKRAFRAYDNNNGGSAIVMQRFNEGGFQNQTYGTVEFWFRVNSTSVNTEIRLNWGHGVNDASIVLRVSGSGQWQYNDGTWNLLPNISNPLPDTWYHFKIHFRCQAAPSYLGLNENHYEVIIDGVSSGSLPFATLATEIAMFIPLYPAWGYYGGNYAYCDAIGYSWDPNYNIGDNLNEGLLISFESNIDLNWTAYSLDNQNNRTILGNKTIPLPDDGHYSVQMFANLTSGWEVQSDLRYFGIDTMNPEILIHFPNQGDILGYISPKYNISIVEANLDSAWYTIDNGATNYSITNLIQYIDHNAWFNASFGPITLRFYARDIFNRTVYKDVFITKRVLKLLSADIVEQSFTTDEFNITFLVYNETIFEIDFAMIQIWWDGTEVSSSIQNLGNGLYFISLDPITVMPGDNPILLNMTISANGYEDKYFETYIAVDPDTLQKAGDKSSEEFPLLIILIISFLSAGIIIGLSGIFWLRRRRKKE